MLSPGLSHNAYVAKMANLDVIQTNRRTHELHVGMRRHLDDRCDDYVHLTGRL